MEGHFLEHSFSPCRTFGSLRVLAGVTFVLLVNLFQTTTANNGYLITHPKELRAGNDEHLSVTIFDPSVPMLIEVRLLWRNQEVANTQKYILGRGTLKIQVPESIRGRATLDVCGNCRLDGQTSGYHFRNYTHLLVNDKSTSVFIQSDKPIYKPGQRVFINFIVTGRDLLPKDDNIFAYIEDPKRTRMMQWKNLTRQCCGVLNATFPLSDQPVLGDWKIFVEVKGRRYNQTFAVQKYVLPKFEVIIEPPSFIADIYRCSPARIHARYVYGKPVRGKVSINMRLAGVGYFDNYISENQFLFMDINGTANFNICVSELVTQPLKIYFKGVIQIEASVVSSNGEEFDAEDDSCLVRRQPLALTFAPECPTHFKPGLPYFGRLLVTFPDEKPASHVTVLIKVKEKTTERVFYSEKLVSQNGVIDFQVEGIPSDLHVILFDAKITAYRGRDPGTDYYEEYYMANSWYSPSGCYIHARSLNENIQVGDHVVIDVLSSCPCDRMLYYDVISRGDIVQSGFKSPSDEEDEVDSFLHELLQNVTSEDERKTCSWTISLTTTHVMAPFSQIAVYYLREDNETVAASFVLLVKPSYENEVSIGFSANSTLPGSIVTMTVAAQQNSCVCVTAVDKSIELLKPGYELNDEKVFQEIGNYSIVQTQTSDTWWDHGGHTRVLMGAPQYDAYFAFHASGLHAMTDRANMRFPRNTGQRLLYMPLTKSTQPRARKIRRAYFPETWLWRCFNMSAGRKQEHIRVKLPGSITTWNTNAFAISETHGLGIAEKIELISVKKFFIDFTLPYSIIRGEQVRIPVAVHNYIGVCVQVTLNIHIQEGTSFINFHGRRKTEYLCLAAFDTRRVNIEISVSKLGKTKIHASAEAFTSYDCCIGAGLTDESIAIDRVIQSLLVEPEGIERGYTTSVFFCPDERIHLSTPNRYEYQFLPKPNNLEYFTFMVRASNDARIALAPGKNSHILYEIVFGGYDNTQTWVSKERLGDKIRATVTRQALSMAEFRAFWITWKGGLIQVGFGEVPSNQSMILRWRDPEPLNVNFLGFTTGFGSTGEFRIWRKESTSDMFAEYFTLTLPLNYIPGSERAKATMIADVMGPTLSNLQNLIRLPFGCGEQNMIHFAPNVYVMTYLQRTGQFTPELETEATGFLVQGYQRQLTYKRGDGSYSAFGESDTSGSMWLTAFVLKSFAQSQSYIYIDKHELQESKDWIISQQMRDGAFPPVGRVLNKDIQGGIQGKVSLTAYVLVALMEAGVENELERQALDRAQFFLERNMDSLLDPYTAALTAYALTLRKSQFANTAVGVLRNKAINDDGERYWSLSGQPLDIVPFITSIGSSQSVTSAEIEMTAYALLTFTAKRDIAYSLPIVKWLTKQRNSVGGFQSTQDTCVALQALSEYASLSYVGHVNLTISLGFAYNDMLNMKHYRITDENSKVLQSVDIPVLSRNLFLSSEGEGCGLLQVDVGYNIPDPSKNPAFRLGVTMTEEELFPFGRQKRAVNSNIIGSLYNKNVQVTIETCARWLHAGSSNMAVIEISLLTGFTADIESLERLLFNRYAKVKRYEIEGRRVILYFDEIPSQCMTCVSFVIYRDFVVGRPQAVPVKVYDYYEPHYEAIQLYNVSHDSKLARELCGEEQCNEVEDIPFANKPAEPSVHNNESPELCNMVDGNCLTMADRLRCMCERTCSYGGPPICGNDGIRYDNYCHMEVAACQKNMVLKAVSLSNCPAPTDTAESLSEESNNIAGSSVPGRARPTAESDESMFSLFSSVRDGHFWTDEKGLPEVSYPDVDKLTDTSYTYDDASSNEFDGENPTTMNTPNEPLNATEEMSSSIGLSEMIFENMGDFQTVDLKGKNDGGTKVIQMKPDNSNSALSRDESSDYSSYFVTTDVYEVVTDQEVVTVSEEMLMPDYGSDSDQQQDQQLQGQHQSLLKNLQLNKESVAPKSLSWQRVGTGVRNWQQRLRQTRFAGPRRDARRR